MSGSIVNVTDQSFDETLLSDDRAVLVDFWAEWCTPCKAIAPILEALADDEAEKLRVVKLNIDENLDTTRRFDVMSIPTLILFKDGQPAARIVGARGKSQLLSEIKDYL
ncbi:MAG: thioredoxin [Acidimicrobiales bacterium]|nr:thioredoxin [Acidimicrobiales bacterium]